MARRFFAYHSGIFKSRASSHFTTLYHSYLAGKIHTLDHITTDREQLKEKGISEEVFNQQLLIFIDGFRPADLTRACAIDDGILRLSEAEIIDYSARFVSSSQGLKMLKFVPASGAASRMFKHLHQSDMSNSDILIKEFVNRFHEMPFAKEIQAIQTNPSADQIMELTLGQSGLGYATAPKGMVLFHCYDDQARTAFEEHLIEAAKYMGNKVCIHFTVPEDKEAEIADFLRLRPANKDQSYDLSFSTQRSSTDTVAVSMENQPYRDDFGKLLFRPGGHGALINNLNENPADLIFIKNIDNVVHESRIEESVLWKKVLGGALIKYRKLIHDFLLAVESVKVSQEQVNSLRKELGLGEMSQAEMAQLLKAPIRVCGMVKNEGEPGGGPFWVKGNPFPQVVESAQVSNAVDQQAILAQASHFNPTDLVCCTLDHHGVAYDLLEFIDHSTCFISKKSIAGTEVKALELPGLWNGAMANWISIFIEVPGSTFNPVKTVNDLLRPMHQPK